jgi:hypothetical protein
MRARVKRLEALSSPEVLQRLMPLMAAQTAL